MRHEAILYSLDPTITKHQLQSGENIAYDAQRYAKFQERASTEKIGAIVAAEHYKCSGIKPLPYILYYVWDISLLEKKILGIVGPRKMSLYAQKVVEELFVTAGNYDMVTISGMAEWVDQLCHSLSMTHHVPTIAVLWWWLGRYSKRPERNMVQEIVAAWGLVLSECRLLDQPTNYTFPQRNRIIAGLSDRLFLPEAGKKSWSLITVEYALAMKIPVYATPSSIFSPTSEGILHLIETGQVKPIVDLKYFLHQYFTSRDTFSRISTSIALTDEEKLLLSGFSHDQWYSLQTLMSTTSLPLDDLIQLLTMLEIKGAIAQDRPGEYILL